MKFVANRTIEQIEQIKSLMGDRRGFYGWMLSNGKSFEGRTLSKEEETELSKLLTSPLYKPKWCFYNCQMIVLVGSNFQYYEGYAQTQKFGINFEHAWLVKDTKVYDPTWKDGSEYFGVQIPQTAVRTTVLATGEAQALLIPYVFKQLEKEGS